MVWRPAAIASRGPISPPERYRAARTRCWRREGFPANEGLLFSYNEQGRPRLEKLEEYTHLGITAREWWTLWPGLAEVEPVEKVPAKEGP